MIKTSYDPEADAMFIWLAPEGAKSVDTREVAPGVMLDYNDAGRLVGIEVLDVRGRPGLPTIVSAGTRTITT